MRLTQYEPLAEADGERRRCGANVLMHDVVILIAEPIDADEPPLRQRPVALPFVLHEPDECIADELFEYLDAPVKRVAAMDTFVAYQPALENAILPQPEDLYQAMSALKSY